jgi:hypothetical protein
MTGQVLHSRPSKQEIVKEQCESRLMMEMMGKLRQAAKPKIRACLARLSEPDMRISAQAPKRPMLSAQCSAQILRALPIIQAPCHRSACKKSVDGPRRKNVSLMRFVGFSCRPHSPFETRHVSCNGFLHTPVHTRSPCKKTLDPSAWSAVLSPTRAELTQHIQQCRNS